MASTYRETWIILAAETLSHINGHSLSIGPSHAVLITVACNFHTDEPLNAMLRCETDVRQLVRFRLDRSTSHPLFMVEMRLR
jgi:hypothetical protein